MWKDADGEEHRVESDVVRYKNKQLLNLYGGTPLVLTVEQRYELETVPEGTRVTRSEEYRGVGVLFWDTTRERAAYVAANEALRAYVMKLK